jgi:Ca2+-binding EF-hand superfamily protein
MDTDKDGAISKDEWNAAGRPEQVFTMFDTDKDGKLTQEEIKVGREKLREQRGGG